MGDLLSGGQVAGYKDIEDALRQAQAAQQQYYLGAVGRLQPYMAAGTRGLGRYEAGLGAMVDPQQFYRQMTAGYQMSPMAQQEMQQARQAAQYGGLAGGMTGETAKRMAQYAQQLSGRDINDYYNRMAGIYGQYLGGQAGLAGAGQRAATQAGQWGMTTGQNLSDILAQMGQAQYGQEVARQSGIGRGLGALFGTAIGSMFGAPGMGASLGGAIGGGGMGGAGGTGGRGIPMNWLTQLGLGQGQSFMPGGQATYWQQPY